MDELRQTAADKQNRRESAIKLKSMETWENIQALAGNLLAAEDLSVVFDANIKSPAHIDLKRRIVRVAQLDPTQKHLIAGLVFHEICHALWTRGNEPVDVVLNMIEDGYIERMGCKKYPGGKKHLRIIFDEFFDSKSVQKKGKSLVTRALNALNYNCKGIKFGKTVPYPDDLPVDIAKFFQKEVELCTLPTLAERNELAKKVKKLLKPYREKKDNLDDLVMNSPLPNMPQEDNDDQDGGGDPHIDWGDENEESKDPKGQDGDDMNDPRNMPDEDKKPKNDGDENKDSDDEGKSDGKDSDDEGQEGDGAGGEDENDSGDDSENPEGGEVSKPNKNQPGSTDALPSEDINTSDLGDAADDDNWLEEHLQNKDENGEVFNHHEEFDTLGSKNEKYQLEVASAEAVFDSANVADIQMLTDPNFDNTEKKRINRQYSRELTAAKKVARLMYQRFLMTKNAHDAQKVSYRRTGRLDIVRLPYYKTNDDLFITRRILPKGENHAIAVMLDWSGSMSCESLDLWKRTAEYVEFSRLAGVDVVIHTFTTGRRYDAAEEGKNLNKYGSMAINHGNFIRLIDTTSRSVMQTQDDLRKFWYLASIQSGGKKSTRHLLRRYMDRIPYYFGMGGTNIVEGHAFGSYIAKLLKKKAEKVSVIVVADGGDSNSWSSLVSTDQEAFDLDNDSDSMSETPRIDVYGSDMVYHGKPLPLVPAHLKAKLAGASYWAENHLGPRQRALLAQVRTAKVLGITTVGVFLGRISADIFPFQAMPYEGALIEWTDMTKGNSFIGVLINQIS